MIFLRKIIWFFKGICTSCGGKLTEHGWYPKERKQKCTVCGK